MTNPITPDQTYTNAKLVGMNWAQDDVPEGYVDLTFRVPETGQEFNALMTADITLKEGQK